MEEDRTSSEHNVVRRVDLDVRYWKLETRMDFKWSLRFGFHIDCVLLERLEQRLLYCKGWWRNRTQNTPIKMVVTVRNNVKRAIWNSDIAAIRFCLLSNFVSLWSIKIHCTWHNEALNYSFWVNLTKDKYLRPLWEGVYYNEQPFINTLKRACKING